MSARDKPTTLTEYPNHEPSMWLRGEAERTLRRVEADPLGRAAMGDGVTLVVTPLRPAAPGTDEDFRCDRCRVDTRATDDGLMHPGFLDRGNVRLMFGLCTACLRREVPE